MKTVRVHQYGGLEALKVEDVPVPEPGEGEARVKIEAIGVNFIDVYHRTGLYETPRPIPMGVEGAGPGSSKRHFTFSVLLHLEAMPVSVLVPSLRGPRQRGQFSVCASAREFQSATTPRQPACNSQNLFLIRSSFRKKFAPYLHNSRGEMAKTSLSRQFWLKLVQELEELIHRNFICF